MKDPAILFYTSDFIAGTLTMTDAQRGKYIILLCLQHQKGYLTEKDMLNICKTYDEDIWIKFKENDGKFYNERMLFETNRRINYSESRRKNRSNICKSYDEHMENENINEDRIKDEFENFWDLYAKKQDRIKCERKWKQLTDEERQNCIKAIPEYVKSTPDKQFRKNPATYLNNKSWENEIINTEEQKFLTHREMLDMTQDNPEIWKDYDCIKQNGKAIYKLKL